MHFNKNFGQTEAVTKLGRERMKIVFPKQKLGELIQKIVPIAKTIIDSFTIADILTEYVDTLPLRTIELCTHEEHLYQLHHDLWQDSMNTLTETQFHCFPDIQVCIHIL